MGNKKIGLERDDLNIKQLIKALKLLDDNNIKNLHPIINELIACAGFQQPFDSSKNETLFVCSSWKRDKVRKNYVEIKILHKAVYELP